MLKMYKLNFNFLNVYGDMLLDGMMMTVIIVAWCLLIGLVLGTLMALFKQSKSRILRIIATVYVDILRNTPFLVQLFFFFYGLPALGIQTDAMATAIIALGINTSAQNCEIIRAGLLAVKKEYFECSEALGYTKMQTLLYFVLPISFRLAFKSLVNNFINLVLTSSVCFSITVVETMGAAKIIVGRTSRPFEIYLMILLCYCIFTYIISFIAKLIDRKIHIVL